MPRDCDAAKLERVTPKDQELEKEMHAALAGVDMAALGLGSASGGGAASTADGGTHAMGNT